MPSKAAFSRLASRSTPAEAVSPPRWRPRPQDSRFSLVASLLLALTLSACEPASRGPYEHRFYAFGTLIEVTLYGLPARDARLISGRLQAHFDRWHLAWHPWEGDGLAALNRALAEDGAATISPDLAGILAHARALTLASEGLFDPGVGALVKLWGFDRGEVKPRRSPPADMLIEDWLADSPTMAALELEGHSARTSAAGLQIDLGGFAKGVAVTRAMAVLRDSGAASGLINAGGDLAVMGRPDDRPWRIGIRSADGDGVLAALTVEDGEAVFTSGDYERDFTDGDRRYHHVLDPRTGRPAAGVRSVTVIHPDPTLADAAATALFVAGPDDWPRTARRLGITLASLIDDRGNLHMTVDMAERMEILREPSPSIRIVEHAAAETKTAETDTE